MMECQICGDREGPFCYQERYTEEKHYIPLVCEECSKKIIKENKRYLKEHKKGGLAV